MFKTTVLLYVVSISPKVVSWELRMIKTKTDFFCSEEGSIRALIIIIIIL